MILRIDYDDREEFPWLIVYGDDEAKGLHLWGAYRTRKGAQRELDRIEILLAFFGVLE